MYYIDNLIVQTATAAPETDADFDDDNDVDGNDFLIWQRGAGAGTSNGQGDADGDSDVDGIDLAIWKSEFGTPQSIASVQSVPEPAGIMLLGMAGLALMRTRTWHR
jgi:hypothetical protein